MAGDKDRIVNKPGRTYVPPTWECAERDVRMVPFRSTPTHQSCG